MALRANDVRKSSLSRRVVRTARSRWFTLGVHTGYLQSDCTSRRYCVFRFESALHSHLPSPESAHLPAPARHQPSAAPASVVSAKRPTNEPRSVDACLRTRAAGVVAR